MASITQAVQQWLTTCPHLKTFTGGAHVDWTGPCAGNYGIMPTGCADIETEQDVLGNVIKHKQYNFALYARNWTIDDVIRLENSDFLEMFQNWVEQQQYAGLTPKVGDNPDDEEISAQNGMLFQIDENGQTGLYQIQIAITYEKHYERN